MVYTVTFNPAIDYVIRMEEVKLGATNRSEREEIYFGGKGINVSIVLEGTPGRVRAGGGRRKASGRPCHDHGRGRGSGAGPAGGRHADEGRRPSGIRRHGSEQKRSVRCCPESIIWIYKKHKNWAF